MRSVVMGARGGVWVVCVGLMAGLCPGWPGGGPPVARAAPVEAPAEMDVAVPGAGTRAVRYEYSGGGLLLSDDGGESYGLMCNRVIDPGVSRETTGILIGPDGALFTGVFSGMWKGSPDGCRWQAVAEFSGRWVTGLVRDPGDPSVLYAITGNGGDDFENGIYRYDAANDSWSPQGQFESALLRNLRVVQRADGLRFYEVLARGQDAQGRANYFVRHSDDGGDSWVEHAFPPTDGTLRLQAVDPTEPARVAVAVTYGVDFGVGDEVYLNPEGGAPDQWALVGRPATFGGAAFSADGALWFADHEGPLSVVAAGASTARVAFEDVDVAEDTWGGRCLHYAAATDELYLCRLFDFGVVERATGDYRPEYDLRQAERWVECEGLDVPDRCEPSSGEAGWCGPAHFPDAPVCAAYGYPGVLPGPAPDAGVALDAGNGPAGGAGAPGVVDAGGMAEDGSTGGDAGNGGCGCRIVASPAGTRPAWPSWPGWCALGLGLALRVRRRARLSCS